MLVYSRASEQRTLWERASCPLLGALIQVIEVQLQAIQAEGDQRCYSQIIVGPEKDNYTLTVGGCDPERSTIYDAFSSFNG